MSIQIHKNEVWSRDRMPSGLTPQNVRNVHEFFVHYPASPSSLGHLNTFEEQQRWMRQIRDFHMDVRGWAYFAYNFAVFQDGEIYQGRGAGHVPAAQAGHNTNTVAVVCVLGNDEVPSDAMKSALRRLKNHVDNLAGRDTVAKPHSSVTATSCPGDRLRAFIPNLNRTA